MNLRIWMFFPLCFLLISQAHNHEHVVLKTPSGGDFSLPTTQGPFYSFKQRGKTMLLFFGFTHCPHVCPLTLRNLSRMAISLPPELQDRLKVVFISVDPNRDNMKVLSAHMEKFNKNFIAGTDTESKLQEILQKFGARYSKTETKDKRIFFDHTSQVFVINARGHWVDSLPYDSSAEEFKKAYLTANSKREIPPQPERDIELLAENKTCSLSEKACEIKTPVGLIKVSFDSHPIVENKKMGMKVINSVEGFVPFEIDFEGIDQDMGFIRSSLNKGSDKTYSGTVTLPVCDLPRMRWKAKLILRNAQGSEKGVVFNFITKN